MLAYMLTPIAYSAACIGLLAYMLLKRNRHPDECMAVGIVAIIVGLMLGSVFQMMPVPVIHVNSTVINNSTIEVREIEYRYIRNPYVQYLWIGFVANVILILIAFGLHLSKGVEYIVHE